LFKEIYNIEYNIKIDVLNSYLLFNSMVFYLKACSLLCPQIYASKRYILTVCDGGKGGWKGVPGDQY
jgi:hypothetical protein